MPYICRVKYKQFKTIVNKVKVELQGDAVIVAASLFQWFNELELKLTQSHVHFEMQAMKEKEPPIKEEKKGKS